ncbi:phage tail protein [Halomicrobium katesii]|uniref:phage tail protein n=1 Tax=Halomicrobium katesii TaxID=437163 RepID=UPI00036A6777|nr:phage tail protein [Halomicrobium katesii]
MTQYTDDNTPYSQYTFEVQIDGEAVAGFSEVSGLNMQLDTTQYQEGGVNDHVHTLPGTMAHANLVLQRGMTEDTTLWKWVQDVMSGKISRRDVVIKLQESYQGDSVWGWEFTDAYPTKWQGPDLVGGNNQITIESIELTYQGFETISGLPE